MPGVLVTAFEPFGGERVNPALEALQRLPDELDGIQIFKLQVPTVFGEAIRVAAQRLDDLRPDVCLCVGQAGGRAEISVERVAINVDDARIPDNAGAQPVDVPVAPDGPAAYFSTLPIKAIAEGIRAAGIPAVVSNTAGTFVCNHLMYGVLHTIHRQGLATRAGFIHIPFLPEQAAGKSAGTPSMSLADIVTALETAIRVALQTRQDLHQTEGALH